MFEHDRNSPLTLSMMMFRMGMASWETIARRSLMMAQGTCSPAEYQRMSAEKVAAMQASMTALAGGRSQAAVIAPFLSRSRANARRLRRNA